MLDYRRERGSARMTERKKGMGVAVEGKKTRNKLQNMFTLFSEWKQEQTSVCVCVCAWLSEIYTWFHFNVNFLKSMNFASMLFWCVWVFFPLPSIPIFSLPQSDLIHQDACTPWISMNFSSVIDSLVSYMISPNISMIWTYVKKLYFHTIQTISIYILSLCNITVAGLLISCSQCRIQWMNKHFQHQQKKIMWWLKLWQKFDGF